MSLSNVLDDPLINELLDSGTSRYALLGHVQATASHPGQAPMGWDAFERLCRGRPVPIYAIGGLARSDLAEAKRRGAHGVALRSAAFDVGQ